MPFKRRNASRGKYPRSKRTRTASRSSAVRVVQKAVRAKLLRQRRKTTSVPRPTSNARAILSNARKIRTLSKRIWGPIQTQQSYYYPTLGVPHITADSPWCFHLNNPTSDVGAPHIYHRNALGIPTSLGKFTLFSAGNQTDMDDTHVVNNPAMLKSILLEFEFEGFLDDTHVRIDIVKSKGIARPDFYKITNNTQDNLLPKCLSEFTRLAGFTQQEIDKQAYKICATKKLYFNSRPSNPTAADVATTLLPGLTSDNYPAINATTRNVKRCKMYMPLNQKLKPLDTTSSQEEYGRTDRSADWGVQDKGTFSYANQDPRSQYWVIISTSDVTALDAAFTSDALSCRIHRKVVWRDPHD